MRTYGRVYSGSTYRWTEVQTAPNGDNTAVYLTTLAQVCALAPDESPFWGNYGIPAQPSVQNQAPPDYYMAITQQQFSPYFGTLSLSKKPNTNTPVYNIVAVPLAGGSLPSVVAK